MRRGSAARFEINQHRDELVAVLDKIAASHDARCGGDCCWVDGWRDILLCDIEAALEAVHVRRAAMPVIANGGELYPGE